MFSMQSLRGELSDIEHASSLENESRSQNQGRNSLAGRTLKSHQSIHSALPSFLESPSKFVLIVESEWAKFLADTLVLGKPLPISGG